MLSPNGVKEAVAEPAAPPDENAVLDLRCISWKDSKRFLVLQAKVVKTDDPDEAIGYIEEVQAILAKAVVSIPHSWLVPDAPPNLDWHKPESLDWLQSQRFEELQTAVKIGGSSEAKNSPAT